MNDGRLLAESIRWEATYDPFFEPPEHSVDDLRRGIVGALQYGGYVVDPKNKLEEHATTQPAVAVGE